MKNTIYILALLFSIALQAQPKPVKVVGIIIDGKFYEFVTGSDGSIGIDSTFVNTQIANASVNITPIKPTANITLTTLNLYKETVNNTATDLVYTIPIGMPIGSFFVCRQGSTGTVSVNVAQGVTTNSTRTTNARGQSLVYSHQGNDFWLVDESVGIETPILDFFISNNAASQNDINAINGWIATSNSNVSSVASTFTNDSFAIRTLAMTTGTFNYSYFDILNLEQVPHTATITIRRVGGSDGTLTNWQGVTAFTSNLTDSQFDAAGNGNWITGTVIFTPTATVQARFYNSFGLAATVGVSGFEIAEIIITKN